MVIALDRNFLKVKLYVAKSVGLCFTINMNNKMSDSDI